LCSRLSRPRSTVIPATSQSDIIERIALAERHVVKGRAIIARQRGLIAWQQDRGMSTRDSELLLSQFERTQTMFEDDLKRLRQEQGPS
jgi:hypothetical protein